VRVARVLMFCLLASVVACSCEKDKNCDFDGAYQFEIPATLSPALDTFQVGDTIHFSSRFSDEVFELKTSQTYSLKSFDFYPITYVYRIDTNISSSGMLLKSLDSFTSLINPKFDYAEFIFNDGSTVLTGTYLYEQNEYVLEFDLITLKEGLYTLQHGSRLATQEGQTFPNKCKDSRIEAIVNLNNNSSNNIDLLLQSPDPHWNDWVLQKPNERYHKFGGYTFYVIE